MKIIPLYPAGKIKALTFSYDDGVRFDGQLIEILNRYGMKGTFNLNAGSLASERKFHADELKEVYAGHEIASHGFEHPFLERIPRSCALNDMLADRRELEKITGRIVNGFALPFGTYDRSVIELLRSAGYLYSRTTQATGRFWIPDDFLQWHPTCHHRDALNFCEGFKNTRYALTLFYIWGHSYEFNNNNNWDLIEKVCADLAGQEDIWYATNGEIMRYLTAVKQLETSADAEIVYNPTAVSLWFRLGSGDVVELKSGETRCLK